MNERVMPGADDVGPSAHPGMDGIVTQEQTKSRIMGICRLAPNDVARVYVLNGNLFACL